MSPTPVRATARLVPALGSGDLARPDCPPSHTTTHPSKRSSDSGSVVASPHGRYEKAAIEEWLRRGHRTSPLTGLPLESVGLTPNMTLKKAISEYLHDQAQQQHTNSSSVEAAKKRPPGMGMLLRLGSSSQTEQGESGAEQQQQKLGRALDRAAVKAEKVKLLLSDPGQPVSRTAGRLGGLGRGAVSWLMCVLVLCWCCCRHGLPARLAGAADQAAAGRGAALRLAAQAGRRIVHGAAGRRRIQARRSAP